MWCNLLVLHFIKTYSSSAYRSLDLFFLLFLQLQWKIFSLSHSAYFASHFIRILEFTAQRATASKLARGAYATTVNPFINGKSSGANSTSGPFILRVFSLASQKPNNANYMTRRAHFKINVASVALSSTARACGVYILHIHPELQARHWQLSHRLNLAPFVTRAGHFTELNVNGDNMLNVDIIMLH